MIKKTVQILLKKDVKGFGKKGELKTAALGFVRNYVLPQKVGIIATPDIIASRTKAAQLEQENRSKAEAQAKALATKLGGVQVLLRVKAGQKGKLFGSVTAKEISQALHDQHSIELKPENISLKTPLKTLGKHSVPVQLSETVNASVAVQIVSSKS
jgi:large subunit ribosomal protein L9